MVYSSELENNDFPKALAPVQLNWEVENYVAKLEMAWSSDRNTDVALFLPPCDHTQYYEIAAELLRVDAECSIENSKVRAIDYYAGKFPELLNNEWVREQLNIELDRLRSELGLVCENQIYPEVGQIIGGFRIGALLGTGAFSKVFLANEIELSDRLVTLKFSTRFHGEASVLAKLQHKNIVPIYSWHQFGALHAVCMPYYGMCTLSTLIRPAGNLAEQKLRQTMITTIEGQLPSTYVSRILGSKGETSTSTPPTDERKQFQESSQKQTDLVAFSVPQSLSERSVLWIGRELADGLSQAHSRGILHRDIKPANILIADDGTPMLLDFNLAYQRVESPLQVNGVGGTPSYMSPEHLHALNCSENPVDETSDLYSLGIVMLELLTGKNPFSTSGDLNSTLGIQKMLTLRKEWSTSRVIWPRGISPALKDIVSKLLQYEPNQRYRHAKQLSEDLDCQLKNLPLINNHNRSTLERITKWSRRHPRACSGGVVGTVLGCAIMMAIAWLLVFKAKYENVKAEQWFNKLVASQHEAQALASPDTLPPSEAERMLRRFDTNGLTSKNAPDYFDHLSTRKSELSKQLLGQILYYQARGKYSLAVRESDTGLRLALMQDAMNDTQSATRYLTLGREANQSLIDVIRQSLSQNSEAPRSSSLNPLEPHELIAQTKTMIGSDAGNPWRWWNDGSQHLKNRNFESALSSAQVVCKVSPSFPYGHYLLGLTHLEMEDFGKAEEAFHEALAGKIDIPEAYMNLAIARLAQGRADQALEDLNKLKAHEIQLPRVFFLREQALRMLGDPNGAELERQKGISQHPSDAVGWAIRADAKLRSDPPEFTGAAADLSTACDLAPNLIFVFENLAYLQAELMDAPDSAILTLTNGIRSNPRSARLIVARGVLYARQGKTKDARSDIYSALDIDRNPMLCYQAASGILLIAESDTDKEMGLSLLAEALRQNPGLHSLMISDEDLKSIHEDLRFKQIMNAVELLYNQ